MVVTVHPATIRLYDSAYIEDYAYTLYYCKMVVIRSTIIIHVNTH